MLQHPRNLGVLLTLFQPEGTDYAHHITGSTPGFGNLTTALAYGMYTYGMYTYGMYTYGMYTYGMYTYGSWRAGPDCGKFIYLFTRNQTLRV